MRVWFWISWGIAATVTAIFVYFFLAGLADGRVSAFNIALWAAILLGLAGVTGGSLWLKRAGHPGPATVLTLLLSLPGLLAALFFLVVLIAHPRWN